MLLLNTDYKDIICDLNYDRMFITSPIDEYFDYKFGKLEYRSINFQFETYNKKHFQGNSVINYPEAQYNYTRITEFKKLTYQNHQKTTICREYPSWEGEPSYPVPRKKNKILFDKYNALGVNKKKSFFSGRLGMYKYLNIDQAVYNSLILFQNSLPSLDLKKRET